MSSVKIVITGPESTGKSALATGLASHYKGILVEEYARKYITGLDRPYTYHDVEHIAHKQIADFNLLNKSEGFVFFDTFLIITKVWFEVVYKKTPGWIDNELKNSKIDLFLLCAPDLPWISDDVRENGGEKRLWLFTEYEKNLKEYNFNYRIVEGFGKTRLINAIQHVEAYLQGASKFNADPLTK